MRLLIAAGALVCLHSLLYLPYSKLDLRFLFISVATIALGSRIGIEFSRLKVQITVSDTFVFLTMLLYGGEAAVLLAACEAFCTSLRFAKKWPTRFFNAALLASSTFITSGP